MPAQPDDRIAQYVRDHVLTLVAVLALALLVYAFLAARYYAGEPAITRNIMAEMNAKVEAIPVEDRAWPPYVEALSKLERLEDNPGIDEQHDLAEVWFDLHPGDELWPDLSAYLDRNAHVLREIRAAAAKPTMGVVLSDAPTADDVKIGRAKAEEVREPSPNPAGVDILLPYLGKTRLMARLLRSDCRYAMDAGDGARAADDLLASFSLAEHAREHGTAIGSLVSVAIYSLALEELMDAVEDRPGVLDDAALAALARRIESFAAGGPLPFPLDGETLMFEDAVQRCYTDDGHGDGYFTRAGWEFVERLYTPAPHLEQYMVIAGATRTQTLKTWGNIMAAWQRDRRSAAWQTDELESETADEALVPDFRSRFHLLEAIFNTEFTRIYQSLEITEQLRTAALTVMALERFRLATGAYPGRLEELTPKYLPVPPVDRFSGGTLRYILRDGMPVLYSVGADGDDDGGGPAPDHDSYMRSRVWRSRAQRARAPDADWVLWPPSAAHDHED